MISALRQAVPLRPRWLRPSALAAAGVAHISVAALFVDTQEPLISAADAYQVAFVQEGEALQETKAEAAPDEQAEIADSTMAQAAAEAEPEEAPRAADADASPSLALEKPIVSASDAPTAALEERPLDNPPTTRLRRQQKEAAAEAVVEEMKDADGKVRRVATAAAEAMATSSAAADRSGATDGKSVSNSTSKARYGARVLQEIQRHMFYPARARSDRVMGQAVVIFTVGAEGKIVERQIVRSTGSEALDHAALVMLDAVKAPPPPGGRFYGRTTIKFDIRR